MLSSQLLDQWGIVCRPPAHIPLFTACVRASQMRARRCTLDSDRPHLQQTLRLAGQSLTALKPIQRTSRVSVTHAASVCEVYAACMTQWLDSGEV
ncbi:hypothetical protein EVAR_13141_1 [Eumeta japonica]|uniref:Uncharacterized protein n=1 Tax=Eumeta variegata TaxID=151549 RepID=A0A4C1U9S5_EUMVA|nr:hypothetical protein EVAR_13141_1 [Eumeta japonica]